MWVIRRDIRVLKTRCFSRKENVCYALNINLFTVDFIVKCKKKLEPIK